MSFHVIGRRIVYDNSACYESLEDIMEMNNGNDAQNAAKGLLVLQNSDKSTKTEATFTPPSSCVNLTPIHPHDTTAHHPYQLPSLSDLFLSPEDDSFYHWNNASNISSSSTANLLYSPYDNTSIIHLSHSRPVSNASTLIPPLSTSTSYSSLRSIASSVKTTSKKSNNLLSRAATFTRRRGRPRKNPVVRYIEMSTVSPSSPSTKPRWQAAEKRGLLEAIVREKNLDDMASIRWDRISMAVGRAKKACKDQWRRELLPGLLKSDDSSMDTTTTPTTTGKKRKDKNYNSKKYEYF